MGTEDLEKQVISALENAKYKWRTIEGVANELSIPPEDVRKVIGLKPDVVIKSTIPSVDGQALYTTRSHYRSKSNPVDRLIGALRNRVD